MDNLSKLGILAAELLLKNKLSRTDLFPESIALVLSNANSSLDTDMQFLGSAKTIPSPSLFVYTLPNIVAGEICIRHKIKGEGAFFVTEKFDSKLMAEYVTLVMAQPAIKVCVAGWIDVLNDHHDVFLYLVENVSTGAGQPHSAEQLEKLYT